jgi:hypothetical protein
MTLIATYLNNNSAQVAYNKLVDTGMERDQISVATIYPNNPAETLNEMHLSSPASDVTGGTTSGAVTGAAIGFLIGAAALTIPGFGALLISGPLVAAFGGGLVAEATLGAAIGGLGGFVTGLVKAGADEKDAQLIQEHLQNGGVILAVKDDSQNSHKHLLELTDPTSLISLTD